MSVKKSEVKEPILLKQAEPVESLGGDVVVRGITLTQRLAIREAARKAAADGKAFELVPQLLAVAVVDHDGEQLFTPEQWDVFGSKNQDEAMRLFEVAYRLGGFDITAERKN